MTCTPRPIMEREKVCKRTLLKHLRISSRLYNNKDWGHANNILTPVSAKLRMVAIFMSHLFVCENRLTSQGKLVFERSEDSQPECRKTVYSQLKIINELIRTLESWKILKWKTDKAVGLKNSSKLKLLKIVIFRIKLSLSGNVLFTNEMFYS